MYCQGGCPIRTLRIPSPIYSQSSSGECKYKGMGHCFGRSSPRAVIPHLIMWRTLLLYESSLSVNTRLSRMIGETIENAFLYAFVSPARAELALPQNSNISKQCNKRETTLLTQRSLSGRGSRTCQTQTRRSLQNLGRTGRSLFRAL